MAFRDQNGKITIDEIAADKDVKAVNAACELYAQAMVLTQRMTALSTELKGETGTAVTESSARLQDELERMKAFSEETAAYIKAVVARYEQIDRELKEHIEAYPAGGAK